MRTNSKNYNIVTEYEGRLYNAEVTVTLTGNTSDDISSKFDGGIEVCDLFDIGGNLYNDPMFIGAIGYTMLASDLQTHMLNEAESIALNDGALIAGLEGL